MGFDSGSISFSLYDLPETMPDDALQRFTDKRGYSLDTVLDEPQIGWVSGRHLLDTKIDDETAYQAGYLSLILRTAVRKIPPSLFKAECKIEELALVVDKKSHDLNRKEKREIREGISERLLKDMPPTLSGIPFVLDPTAGALYVGATTQPKIDHFLYNFCDTIGFEPVRLTPEILTSKMLKIDAEDLPQLNFANVRHHDESGTCLGRDFATWLWYFQDNCRGIFSVDGFGEFGIMIEGPLIFAAGDADGQETVVRKGLPTLSREASSAIQDGKKLKRAKFILVHGDEVWRFTFDADNFVFGGTSLPQISGLDAISRFQERMKYFNIFRLAVMRLFEIFLVHLHDHGKFKRLSAQVLQWANELQSRPR